MTGLSLSRAAFASFMAAAKQGGTSDPHAFAERLYPQDTVARRILLRGIAMPLATSNADLTGALVINSTGDFLGGLAPLSAGARLIAGGLRVTLAPEAQIALPFRPAAATPLSWVPEGNPIPVRSYALNKVLVGPVRKMAAITVHSRELARQSGAEAVFTTLLREDAAASLDAALFATTPASDAAPAGLLNGVTPLAPTAGGGVAAMEADLVKLASAVTANGGNTVLFVAAPAQAESVAIRKPDLAPRVLASAALAAGTVIAIDAAALVSAFGPEPDIESSVDAALHMDRAPHQISTPGAPNVVAAPVWSTFQAGLIATRLILDVAFALRASGLVAYLTGATLVSPHESARERAAEVLANVERTLAAPRPQGRPHRIGATDEGFEAWQARKLAEAEAAARPKAPAPRSAPVATGNTLCRLSDEGVVKLLGQMFGELRREMMAEQEALAALVGELERRIAKMEGTTNG